MVDKQQIMAGFEDLVKPNIKAKLESRFIIPPFSVFDTRQGYWQNRKKQWLELGVKSEIGRDDNLTYTGKVADIHAYDGQSKTQKYAEEGRDPNLIFKSAEMTSDNLNFYRNKTKSEKEGKEKNFYESIVAERGGGTSIFDPVLCELCYKWFCPIGGTIIDPFSGGSVRGIVAHILGYKYYGIDLSEKQIQANIEQGKLITPDNPPNWINGNSKNLYKLLPESFLGDFVFSCPPYFDLEVYSNKMGDLSNMTWNDFRDDYSDIIYKSVQCLKQDRFACFVISEIRDKNGFYRGFVPFTIQSFIRAGAQLYNQIILVNQVGSLPIRINRQFGDYRKIGRVHQEILIFYRGNPDNIPKIFKHIDIDINETSISTDNFGNGLIQNE